MTPKTHLVNVSVWPQGLGKRIWKKSVHGILGISTLTRDQIYGLLRQKTIKITWLPARKTSLGTDSQIRFGHMVSIPVTNEVCTALCKARLHLRPDVVIIKLETPA